MHTVHFGPGEHISRAACRLVDAAKKYGEANGFFNEIELVATSTSLPQDITEYFTTEIARQSAAYWASPAGIAAKKRDQEEIATAEKIRDRLLLELPSLDFSNETAVLDWLCALQVPSDRVGVKIDAVPILSAFERHGLLPGMNCGDDFDGENRANFYGYIVGQGLTGLKDGPAIHWIINKFTDQWKEKFEPSALSVA